MVTFGQNLRTWKTARNLTSKNLGDRSGLGEGRITELLEDKSFPTQTDIEKIARVFQVSVPTFTKGVSLEDPEEDPFLLENTEEVDSLYQDAYKRFDEFPREYQLQVTKKFADWIQTKSNMRGAKIEDMYQIPRSSFSTYRMLKRKMSYEIFSRLANVLDEDGLISKKDFIAEFKKTCEKYISTYNLCIAEQKYGFQKKDLAEYLDKSNSSITYISRYVIPVSSDVKEILLSLFEVNNATFTNDCMKPKDFALDKDVVLAKLAEKKKSAVTSSTKDPSKDDQKKTSKLAKKEKYSETPPVVDTKKLKKMYDTLSDEHKSEVNALIERYFWQDL